MKLLSKIRAAGLSLLLVLSAGSLVQAAAPVDKAVVKDLVRSQSVMAKEKYIQYEMKGTLFSPIGVGNLTLTGNGVEETDKKNTRMEKLSGDLHGTGELTLLTGQQTVSQPIDGYFFAEKGQLTQYINSGKGWAKTVRTPCLSCPIRMGKRRKKNCSSTCLPPKSPRKPAGKRPWNSPWTARSWLRNWPVIRNSKSRRMENGSRPWWPR